ARDVLAEVGYLSHLTNDLAQYTMAADRGLCDVASLLHPWNPALLDLVARTAAAGAAPRKPEGLYVKAAAHPLRAPVAVARWRTAPRRPATRRVRVPCAWQRSTPRCARSSPSAERAAAPAGIRSCPHVLVVLTCPRSTAPPCAPLVPGCVRALPEGLDFPH